MNIYCWIILFNLVTGSPSYQRKVLRNLQPKMAICTQVYNEAVQQSVDPFLAISVAYRETRFKNVVSNKGAQGPMGVIPKYHCPKQGKCDYIKAGVHALKRYMTLNKQDICKSLAQYNRGNKGQCKKGRSEYKYAKSVLKLYDLLLNYDLGC